jgi:hypothetical protein
MFKASSPLFSGLLWKIPWRISSPQKARQRKRLRAVDRVVDTLSAALRRNGQSTKAVDRWYAEMPREEEMLPKDKYTLFDKKEKTYRKGIHSMFVSALSLLHSLWPLCTCFLSRRRYKDADGSLFRTAQVDKSQPALEPSWFLSSLLRRTILFRTVHTIR